MKAFFTLLPLLVLFFAGCASSGVSSRIKEKASLYQTLPPEVQSKIRQGIVDRGFTEDMVYIAIGKPASVEIAEIPEGEVEMWTYKNYYGAQGALQPVFNQPGEARQRSWVSPNAPGGPSLASTRGGVQTVLDVPDMVASTLRVFFYGGFVVGVLIEPST